MHADTESFDEAMMRRALEISRLGQGYVEPNPMVGCVIANEIADGMQWHVASGRHERFGGPHAEIEALKMAGERARGSTLYVTLEPCCHFGKTPPCTQAIIAAGVKRVVAAMRDPFPKVAGGGFAELKQAGIEVVSGVLQAEAEELNAPYLKLLRAGKPWVIAKWAMTLDGKIATRTGESKWISGPESREIVHQLRNRMDANIVGRRTAELDDPLLTARSAEIFPPMRIATRIVVDSTASLSLQSQLVRSAREFPLLVAAAKSAPAERVKSLEQSGAEVIQLPGDSHAERLEQLLLELGKRRMTNVLVEGGSQLLGALFDAGEVDEVHCFIAPKIFGGSGAPGPIGGRGIPSPELATLFHTAIKRPAGDDLYVHGRLIRGPQSPPALAPE